MDLHAGRLGFWSHGTDIPVKQGGFLDVPEGGPLRLSKGFVCDYEQIGFLTFLCYAHLAFIHLYGVGGDKDSQYSFGGKHTPEHPFQAGGKLGNHMVCDQKRKRSYRDGAF